MYIYLLKIKEI